MDSLKKLYELYEQQIAALEKTATEQDDCILHFQARVAALTADIECYEAMKEGASVRISDLEEQIAALKTERDLLKKHQTICECGGLSIDHNISDNHQVLDMISPCPFSEQIAALTAEMGLKDKQNAELRERLNKSWEREDAQGHDLLRLSVTACYSIADLKAKVEKLREALKRIRDWPYDIMNDCVYDAKKEAEDALKEAI